MNTVITDRAGRVVQHRKTKRGVLIGHTPVTVQRGVSRVIAKAFQRRQARIAARRYPW